MGGGVPEVPGFALLEIQRALLKQLESLFVSIADDRWVRLFSSAKKVGSTSCGLCSAVVGVDYAGRLLLAVLGTTTPINGGAVPSKNLL